MKKIMNEVLSSMFGDDTKRFAGFNKIVATLIESGWCTTTKNSKEMNFHDATEFISVEGLNNDLEILRFDRDKAIVSEKFKSLILELKNESTEELKDLLQKVKSVKEKIKSCETILKKGCHNDHRISS